MNQRDSIVTNGKTLNRNQVLNFKGKINGYSNNNRSSQNYESIENRNFLSLLFPKEVLHLFKIGSIIGDGNFAMVYSCTHKQTKSKFALKVIDKTKCRGREFLISSEVSVLRNVSHPNIVRLFDEFDFTNELYLVMELVKVVMTARSSDLSCLLTGLLFFLNRAGIYSML